MILWRISLMMSLMCFAALSVTLNAQDLPVPVVIIKNGNTAITENPLPKIPFLQKPAVVPSKAFDFFWTNRSGLQQALLTPAVVQHKTKPEMYQEKIIPMYKLSLDVKKLLKSKPGFKPFELNNSVSYYGACRYMPQGEKLYLEMPSENQWQLMVFKITEHKRKGEVIERWETQSGKTTMAHEGENHPVWLMGVSVSGLKDPLIDAVETLMIRKKDFKNEAAQFRAFKKYLKSQDKDTRRFAARYAGENGLSLNRTTPPDIRNAYARLILEEKDPNIQTTLARAYRLAGIHDQDVLPDNLTTLQSLLSMKNTSAAQQAILGLAACYKREQLASIVKTLLEMEKRPELRFAALYAIRGRSWKPAAKNFLEPIRKIVANQKGYAASKKTGDFERIAAFRLAAGLSYGGTPQYSAEILKDIPSAIVMRNAVHRGSRNVIPVVLDALKKKRYPLTNAIRCGLTLLAGKTEFTNLKDYQAWWDKIQKHDEYKNMMRYGF